MVPVLVRCDLYFSHNRNFIYFSFYLFFLVAFLCLFVSYIVSLFVCVFLSEFKYILEKKSFICYLYVFIFLLFFLFNIVSYVFILIVYIFKIMYNRLNLIVAMVRLSLEAKCNLFQFIYKKQNLSFVVLVMRKYGI